MNKLIGTLIAFVLIVLGGVTLIGKNNVTTLGSTTVGNEYNSTSTKSYNGTAISTFISLKTTSGTLGSVIIGGATAGQVINLYDATSTLSNSQTGTSTLVTIPSTALGGTYTYDLNFYRGLLLEVIGATGTSTITYR